MIEEIEDLSKELLISKIAILLWEMTLEDFVSLVFEYCMTFSEKTIPQKAFQERLFIQKDFSDMTIDSLMRYCFKSITSLSYKIGSDT